MRAESVESAYKGKPGDPEVAKISTLLSRYGKDIVMSMLAAAKDDKTTNDVATSWNMLW